jgi:hypothetical protein
MRENTSIFERELQLLVLLAWKFANSRHISARGDALRSWMNLTMLELGRKMEIDA